MATIEDKILDGPRIHYCDADDDDRRTGDDANDDQDQDNSCTMNSRDGKNAASLFSRPDEESERLNRISQQSRWQGSSTNTGPKGVIEDYKKKSLLAKQTSQATNELDELDAEFQELLNDESFIKEYMSKRISDAIKSNTPTFGQVFRLQTGTQLLDMIDKENPNVLVVVHIYTKFSRSCMKLNRCLDELANDLKHIKFVSLDASVTGLSANFKERGVPALLAYKNGDLIKSLVQLEDLLDQDFEAIQVKELLIDDLLAGKI